VPSDSCVYFPRVDKKEILKFDVTFTELVRLRSFFYSCCRFSKRMLKKIVSVLAIAASASFPFTPAALGTTATYYSDAYQGSPTASGEPYDAWGYTAAHPSYRLGTVVRVTNLNNGRSVTVRINDRCNCGIDLSRAAAGQIGLLRSGVAPVSVTPLR
jgi:rare lipoprotein A